MGLRRKVQRDLMGSALPEDLQVEFHHLSEWAYTLPGKFGDRVRIVETRPLSAQKRWRVVEILQKAAK